MCTYFLPSLVGRPSSPTFFTGSAPLLASLHVARTSLSCQRQCRPPSHCLTSIQPIPSFLCRAEQIYCLILCGRGDGTVKLRINLEKLHGCNRKARHVVNR